MDTTAPVTRFTGPHREDTHDHLAVEEPLQIRLAGEDVAVTMRTPGHDHELAAGFLFTEGIIAGRHHIESIAHCPDTSGASDNVVNVQPTERGLLEPHRWASRNFYSTSSCGLCGKTSIEQITTRTGRLNHNAKVSLQTLYDLPKKLQAAQVTFAQTGGLHAAALFDLDGNLLLLREDVGRHNAVDKVIGHALLNDLLPLDHHILLVSSRASFEIVQKALMAGIGILAVVSAPSSLAVELAREAGMTLVAFLREERLNVYAGEERIIQT
jgi:FdhD protein